MTASPQQWVTKHHIMHLKENGQFDMVARKLISLTQDTVPSIELLTNEFTTFISIINFCQTALSPDYISPALRNSMEQQQFDPHSDYNSIALFYNTHAKEFLQDMEVLFSTNPSMLKALSILTH